MKQKPTFSKCPHAWVTSLKSHNSLLKIVNSVLIRKPRGDKVNLTRCHSLGKPHSTLIPVTPRTDTIAIIPTTSVEPQCCNESHTRSLCIFNKYSCAQDCHSFSFSASCPLPFLNPGPVLCHGEVPRACVSPTGAHTSHPAMRLFPICMCQTPITQVSGSSVDKTYAPASGHMTPSTQQKLQEQIQTPSRKWIRETEPEPPINPGLQEK